MTTFIDVQLIEGLGLPYAPGAEAALLDDSLSPLFNDAWQAFVATFPGLTLLPLFDGLPVEQLADLVDAVRVKGDEPPDPFVWFTLECDEALVETLVPAVQALPMVALAFERIATLPTGQISYGTNLDAGINLQIQPAPNGVDAIYAWDVPGGAGDGVRIADNETAGQGWLLGHDELLTARIRKISVSGVQNLTHGTAVAGIVVGADNGVGTIGIVPNAELNLVNIGFGSAAAAIDVAAASLRSGDVLVLEYGDTIFPGSKTGDVLPEFDFACQNAIRRATKFGIIVIEAAGNSKVNLDAFPFLAHTSPASPKFVDSGAIVVGAGEFDVNSATWRRTFSSFGSRVDCFAAGSEILSPSGTSTHAYDQFSGTSGACAIVAGVVASLQGMTRASSRSPLNPEGLALSPADVRRLLRDPDLGTLALGTPPSDGLGHRIGAMPDLRKIAHAQGLTRVLPIGAASIGGDALLIVHLDADNRLVRRHFTLLTGWGQPIPSPAPNDLFELSPAQPAVTSSDETDPIERLVFDAFLCGPAGIHHIFWDSRNQIGDVTTPIARFTETAQGRSLAAVRPVIDSVVVAAISPAGRLVVMSGDPDVLVTGGLSTPLVLDDVGMYRRVSGPSMVTRSAGLVDIVAIEDGGGLSWFTGNIFATTGTGFSPRVTEPSAVEFEPGARPALLVTGDLLLAAAVSSEGFLRVATIDPAAFTIDVPVVVDVQVTIDTSGPIALGLTTQNVVVLAVDTEGFVRAATRPISGGDWTPLLQVLAPITISPLGGVVAVTLDIGVMAIAVGVDGTVHSAISLDGLIWPPLLPLP